MKFKDLVGGSGFLTKPYGKEYVKIVNPDTSKQCENCGGFVFNTVDDNGYIEHVCLDREVMVWNLAKQSYEWGK